jgi:hypothetical protein
MSYIVILMIFTAISTSIGHDQKYVHTHADPFSMRRLISKGGVKTHKIYINYIIHSALIIQLDQISVKYIIVIKNQFVCCTIKCDTKNHIIYKPVRYKSYKIFTSYSGTSIADNRPVQFMYNKVERQSNPY